MGFGKSFKRAGIRLSEASRLLRWTIVAVVAVVGTVLAAVGPLQKFTDAVSWAVTRGIEVDLPDVRDGVSSVPDCFKEQPRPSVEKAEIRAFRVVCLHLTPVAGRPEPTLDLRVGAHPATWLVFGGAALLVFALFLGVASFGVHLFISWGALHSGKRFTIAWDIDKNENATIVQEYFGLSTTEDQLIWPFNFNFYILCRDQTPLLANNFKVLGPSGVFADPKVEAGQVYEGQLRFPANETGPVDLKFGYNVSKNFALNKNTAVNRWGPRPAAFDDNYTCAVRGNWDEVEIKFRWPTTPIATDGLILDGEPEVLIEKQPGAQKKPSSTPLTRNKNEWTFVAKQVRDQCQIHMQWKLGKRPIQVNDFVTVSNNGTKREGVVTKVSGTKIEVDHRGTIETVDENLVEI